MQKHLAVEEEHKQDNAGHDGHLEDGTVLHAEKSLRPFPNSAGKILHLGCSGSIEENANYQLAYHQNMALAKIPEMTGESS